MDVAKDIAKRTDLKQSSFFVVTQSQTRGKGRLGRNWVQSSVKQNHTSSVSCNSTKTPKERIELEKRTFQNLYKNENDLLPFTYALHTSTLKIPLEWLTLMTGVAVYDAFLTISKFIKMRFGLNTQTGHLFLKWPNDILWKTNTGKYKKISGILCETQMMANHNPDNIVRYENESDSIHLYQNISHIFIGIGVNFFTAPFVSDSGGFFEEVFLKNNLKKLSIKNKNLILEKLFKTIAANIKKYLCNTNDVSNLQKHALKRMFPLNTALKLKDNASIGTFFGLDESGSLQILTSEQNIQTVYSADSIEISKNNKNLICIDFGNTRIHMTAINEFHEVSELHFHYDTFSTIKNKFKKFIRLFQSDFITKIRTVYISVNSARKTSLALKGIQGLLQMYLPDKNIKSQKVTEKEIFKNFPILNTFDQKTLGADRSLKCIFSYTKSQEINKNVLVVSFGTATTCEGFTPEGKMIENFVYPGVQMSFDALHHFTALLPRIDAKKSKFIENPNYWTQELYLNRGITIILVASILLVAKLHGPCRIFLTGGDSHLIKQILLALVPKELLDNLDIEITENIETKILAEYYEKFK